MKIKDPDQLAITIAQNVRELRLQKGWSFQQLANRASIARSYVQAIENAETQVSVFKLLQVVNALGLKSIDNLLR